MDNIGFDVCVSIKYVFGWSGFSQKDIEQQTILYYDGDFEIIETSHGIYDKAVFLLNGEEICLKYSDEEDYDFEEIKVGKYVGQIVYAKNLSLVLKLKIEEKFD